MSIAYINHDKDSSSKILEMCINQFLYQSLPGKEGSKYSPRMHLCLQFVIHNGIISISSWLRCISSSRALDDPFNKPYIDGLGETSCGLGTLVSLHPFCFSLIGSFGLRIKLSRDYSMRKKNAIYFAAKLCKHHIGSDYVFKKLKISYFKN